MNQDDLKKILKKANKYLLNPDNINEKKPNKIISQN